MVMCQECSHSVDESWCQEKGRDSSQKDSELSMQLMHRRYWEQSSYSPSWHIMVRFASSRLCADICLGTENPNQSLSKRETKMVDYSSGERVDGCQQCCQPCCTVFFLFCYFLTRYFMTWLTNPLGGGRACNQFVSVRRLEEAWAHSPKNRDNQILDQILETSWARNAAKGLNILSQVKHHNRNQLWCSEKPICCAWTSKHH